MVPLTVIPALLPNNKELSVASDSGGNSCQCKKQYVGGWSDGNNRVRIGEIRNNTSWWWQPSNLCRSTGSLFRAHGLNLELVKKSVKAKDVEYYVRTLLLYNCRLHQAEEQLQGKGSTYRRMTTQQDVGLRSLQVHGICPVSMNRICKAREARGEWTNTRGTANAQRTTYVIYFPEREEMHMR